MVDRDAMLIQQLKQAISETVSEFMTYPVDFLYESDIQSLLFAKLRHEMRDVRFRSEAKDVQRFFKFVPNINPVKTEYPLSLNGSRARFDVAVLSNQQDPTLKIWNQFCRIAIEIKLWQPDGTGALPFDDLKKLQTYCQLCNSNKRAFTGIAMLFVHPGAEQWLKSISGIESEVSFPYDDVAFHVVGSSRWYEVR
jgi:hypothetical protein